jgi:RNA polymerase sigma-70 factor, ECF subfamily
MDDDELIAALAAGDDTALRELFVRHAPWLAARLAAALPPPDVEDVLQETFLAVWKGASGYRPRGTPQAWMWVIARNQAALLLRRRGPVTAPLEETPHAGPDPAEAAMVRAGITAALDGPEGEVLRLMYVEDRPVARSPPCSASPRAP